MHVLGRRANIGMYEFILDDEHARECGGDNVDCWIALRRQAKALPQYGGQDAKCVQRMSEVLPARQPAGEVEVELIHKAGETLR